jgi:ABC-type glycerol-3-phosphate transport system substrate-binding protein
MVLALLGGCSKKDTEDKSSTDNTEKQTSNEQKTGGDEKNKEPVAGGDEKEAVTIKWASWVFAEEAQLPTYKAMSDNYMSKNSHVNVELDTNPYAQYLDQLLIAAAAGNTPDVAHIKAEWLPQFLELGVVKSVSGLVSNEVLSDYSQTAIDAVTIDGQMMAMPWFNNTYAIFYNKALLEKAGITQLPQSWDELLEAAEKVSALGTDENGNKIYGLAIPSGGTEAGEGYNLFPALWANGGNFIGADGKVNLTDDAAIKTFTQLQKLLVDEISPYGSSFKDLRNLFGQGVVGFYWDIEGIVGAILQSAADPDAFKEQMGYMVIPGNGTPNGHGYLIDHLLITFNSIDDARMGEVMKFMEFLTGPECINQLYVDGKGKMSSRSSVMAEVFKDVQDPTATFVKAMETARALPTADLHFMDADEKIVEALQQLAQGKDVTTVMTDTQKIIQDLYDGN